jgi:mannose-6-phosphate isomerase-like protein (cupin superfamily)
MQLSINERSAKHIDFEGRTVSWLQTPADTGGRYSSVCTVAYEPGARAKPAHAHINGEETIFVLSGFGKVKVGDEVFNLEPKTAVLFPQGVFHMVWNTGETVLRLVCFYAPKASAIEYIYDEKFDFDEFNRNEI